MAAEPEVILLQIPTWIQETRDITTEYVYLETVVNGQVNGVNVYLRLRDKKSNDYSDSNCTVQQLSAEHDPHITGRMADIFSFYILYITTSGCWQP